MRPFLLLMVVTAAAWGMGRTPPETQPEKPKEPTVRIIRNPGATTMAEPVMEWKGQFSSISVPYVQVIKDVDVWRNLWTETFKKDAPPVDFEKFVAGVVFIGAKSTGGYGVDFGEPVAKDGMMDILWKAKTPAPGGMVIQAFTQPWAIKLFPRPAGDIQIEQPAR